MAPARTILITGAGRNLGRAMALHLAAPGTRLLLHHGASAEGARDTAALAEQAGAQAVTLQADLADPRARERLMAAAGAAGDGRLDVLINNAGVYHPTPLLDTDMEQWRRVLEVNCNAVFHLIQLARPLLLRGAGDAPPARIITLGDSGADRIVARLEAPDYHLSKLGVHLLTRSFAKALTGQGVTVNMISPGFLENSAGETASPIPAGRAGRFDDVLGALDYLLSDAAGYVSGGNIVVSGGWNL